MRLIEDLPPLATLAPAAFLAGMTMLWIFRRFSDQARLRGVKRQLAACFYELRLFADEPLLVWRAQKRLLTWNLRYVALLLRPMLVLALPMALLFVQLDAFYARSPLVPGQASIVTVQMNRDLGSLDPPLLEVPAGISVETPAVRVPSERQISWRIRPVREVSGEFSIVWPDGALRKTIVAAMEPGRLSVRRTSSILDWLRHPVEKRLPAGPVDWIAVRYPPRPVGFLGFKFHWVVYFLVISTLSALLLKKRFRVSL